MRRILVISFLITQKQQRRQAWCSAQRIKILYDCRWQSYHNSDSFDEKCTFHQRIVLGVESVEKFSQEFRAFLLQKPGQGHPEPDALHRAGYCRRLPYEYDDRELLPV